MREILGPYQNYALCLSDLSDVVTRRAKSRVFGKTLVFAYVMQNRNT